MFKFSPPSPASVPVHVTGMLVVPENVHTGDPPFLKCGLDAKAAVAMTATMSGTKGTISTRFICFLPFLPPPDRPPFGKASTDKPRRTTCFTPLECSPLAACDSLRRPSGRRPSYPTSSPPVDKSTPIWGTCCPSRHGVDEKPLTNRRDPLENREQWAPVRRKPGLACGKSRLRPSLPGRTACGATRQAPACRRRPCLPTPVRR